MTIQVIAGIFVGLLVVAVAVVNSVALKAELKGRDR